MRAMQITRREVDVEGLSVRRPEKVLLGEASAPFRPVREGNVLVIAVSKRWPTVYPDNANAMAV